jgi:hypothetical protein
VMMMPTGDVEKHMLRGAMTRRYFISRLAVTASAWPLAAGTQQAAMPIVGFVTGRSPEDSSPRGDTST